MKMNREYESEVQVITREDGTKHLEGYALVFYNGDPKTEYTLSPGKIERIKREDVDKALENKKIIPLRYNHSKDYLLDDTSRTLVLRTDEVGLKFSCPFDEADPDHMKVQSKLSKGIIKGSSFEAIARHHWERDGEKAIGWVADIDFSDISVVHKPAYEGTMAIVRSSDELEEIEREYNAAFPQQEVEPEPDPKEVIIRSLEEKVALLERQISDSKQYKYLLPQTMPSGGVASVKDMTKEEFKRYIDSI